MAENSTGLTTEQLLMELGKVVLGLGRKLEILSEKMDAIHSVLAEDIAPALKMTGSEKTGEAAVVDMTPLVEKLQILETILSGEILPAIKEIKTSEDSVSVDLAPVVEKIDAVTAAIGSAGLMEELKPLLEGLSASFEQLPSKMTDKLKDLKDTDSSNSTEVVEKKLIEACNMLEDILKISEDRKYVETLSQGISEVKEQLVLSGDQVLGIVKEVPEKIDKMGEDISEAMKAFSETTGAILDKAEKSINHTNESLGEVKNELEKGLKMNTDMTSQMVDLTARFTDKVEEDRILDLNTRAIGHFNRGEYTESDILFSKAISISPENSEILCNAAHLKAAMEDMDEAEKLFRRALEVSPDLEPAISGLGMLMVKTNRAEETIEFLKKALSDGVPSVRTSIAYARALAALDKHDQAVELLETSLRAAPDNHDLAEELARYGHEEKS